MKISIFGIGYVGAVNAAVLAEAGHQVIAVDILPEKIAALRAGNCPFIEPGLCALIERHAATGRLTGTLDAQSAVLQSDISLLCVGTPGAADGLPDLTAITAVLTSIAAALPLKKTRHLIVNRSTVLPGTLTNTLCPLVEKISGLRAGEDFGIGNNPEFLREGSALADFYNPAMILAGVTDEDTGRAIMALYEGIDAPREICAPEIAESVKYISNAWRANKVAFANEMGNVLKAHGIDSHAAMNIFFNDTKINLGKSFLMPGFAFGGSCLPKDVRALRASANDRGLKTPLFDSLLQANEAQIRRGFELIRQTGRRKVALLGLSFKAGTDDLRESPLAALAEMLQENSYELTIYDPAVRGTIAMYPHLAPHYIEDAALLGQADVMVIGNSTPEFAQIISAAPASVPVIDFVRLAGAEQRDFYTGICW